LPALFDLKLSRWRRVISGSLTALLALSVCPFSVVKAAAAEDFLPLFNGRDLQGWETWQGARVVPSMPIKLWGEWEDVVGLNKNAADVFTVVMVDSEPAIRISGEIWGALVSENSYSDYHLRLQFKWGDRKYAPREDKPRNSGLLYHSNGDHGAFWSYWMRSAEFEIMQGSTGMFAPVDKVTARIPTAWDFSLAIPWLRYASAESETGVGGMVFRVQASEDRERPAGEWNTLELYVLGDRALHIVNGVPVMSVRRLRQDAGEGDEPLTAGKIQLQSEGAEVFFRHIELQSITSIAGD
jgi:hypothetical protein